MLLHRIILTGKKRQGSLSFFPVVHSLIATVCRYQEQFKLKEVGYYEKKVAETAAERKRRSTLAAADLKNVSLDDSDSSDSTSKKDCIIS